MVTMCSMLAHRTSTRASPFQASNKFRSAGGSRQLLPCTAVRGSLLRQTRVPFRSTFNAPLTRISNSKPTVLQAAPLLTEADLAQPFLLYNSVLTYVFLPLLIAPRWKYTRMFYESELPLVAFSLAFLYFFVAASIIDNSSSEEMQQKVVYLFTEAITDPRKLAAAFNTPAYIAQDWVHLTVWDFFVWRWIYLDAMKYNTPLVRLSVLTVFNSGPLGLLFHLTVKGLTSVWRKNNGRDETGALIGAGDGQVVENGVTEKVVAGNSEAQK